MVHELYESGQLTEAVCQRFGAEVAPDGVIDRAELARRAFAGPDERAWLEGLLWPKVGERIAAWREEVARRQPPPPVAVIEVPLLFEAGMEGAFDATVAVVADENVRSARADARGHQALAERSSRQLTQREKAERATYTVTNDGSEEDLQAKLSDVLAMLE